MSYHNPEYVDLKRHCCESLKIRTQDDELHVSKHPPKLNLLLIFIFIVTTYLNFATFPKDLLTIIF